jgi:hypothetical protein
MDFAGIDGFGIPLIHDAPGSGIILEHVFSPHETAVLIIHE